MCAISSTATDSRRAAPPESSAIIARSRTTAAETFLECCVCKAITPIEKRQRRSQFLVEQIIHCSPCNSLDCYRGYPAVRLDALNAGRNFQWPSKLSRDL